MKFTCLFVGILLACLSYGQISTVPTRSVQIFAPKILPTSDGGFLQLKVESNSRGGHHWKNFRNQFTVLKYNSDMVVLKEKSVSDDKDKFSALMAQLVKSGDKYWIVYIQPTDSKQVNNVQAIEIDPITLETKGEKTLATGANIDEKIGAYGGFWNYTAEVITSPDSNYHLLQIDNNKDAFFLACYNKNWDNVWMTKVNIPDYEHDDLQNIKIDDEASAYITTLNNKKYNITVVDKKGAISYHPLNFNELNVYDLQLQILSKKKQVVLAGFYGVDGYCKGIMSAILDKRTVSATQIQTNEFPDSLVRRLKKDGFASIKNKNFGIYKMLYRSISLEQPDGNLVIVTEFNDHLGSNNITLKGVGSLLAIHFTSKGALFSHIPRYGVANNFYEQKEYLAYTCSDKTILFYWDNASNLLRDLKEEQKVLHGNDNAVIVGAEISSDGVITRKQVNNLSNHIGITSFYSKACKQ